MKDRLENLRLYFPAEVTGSYLAIQGLLNANHTGPSESPYFMIMVAIALALVNAVIYWKFYKISGILWIAVITVGFFIWILNIDIARFKDVWPIGQYIEVYAPTLLVFYTLVTSMFEIPKRKTNVANS